MSGREQKPEGLDAFLEADGHALAARLRAPRAVPRRLRHEAEVLARAAEAQEHPKLQARVDRTEVERAYKRLKGRLGAIDPVERRRTRMLNAAAALSFVFIELATAALFLMVERGVLGPQAARPTVEAAE